MDACALCGNTGSFDGDVCDCKLEQIEMKDDRPMKHVVFNSGGIGSWATGMRVAEKYGSENIIQLFTDTKKLNDAHPHRGEDEDLYRFLRESSPLIGGQLEWVSAGKDIWRSFEDNRYMGIVESIHAAGS